MGSEMSSVAPHELDALKLPLVNFFFKARWYEASIQHEMRELAKAEKAAESLHEMLKKDKDTRVWHKYVVKGHLLRSV